jgi:methylglyoxal/glyoxal reductase
MPVLGFGVYRIPDGDIAFSVVKEAIKTGFRHFDTASLYNNESSVGKAVNESDIPRNQLFVTTKLWNDDQGYEQTIKAFNRSLKRLGLKYIDLYLIHWPVTGKRKESWRALETLYAEGKCRAIGVSNFMQNHLTELLDYCKVVPTVNQIELHPFNYKSRLNLVTFCKQTGIQAEAYSPLVKGNRLTHPLLVEIAHNYKKSTAQLLIRWMLQAGIVAIPKTKTFTRIKENADVFDFEISGADWQRVFDLNDNYLCSWDPTKIP